MQERYIDTAMRNAEMKHRKKKIKMILFGLVCALVLVILLIKWITPNDIRDYPHAPGRIFSSDSAVVEKYQGEPMYIRGNIISCDQKENGEIELLVHTKKGDVYLDRNMELALFSMDYVPEFSGECNVFFVYQGWDSAADRIYGNYLGISQGEGEIFEGWPAYKEVRVHFYVPPAFREKQPVTPTPVPTP